MRRDYIVLMTLSAGPVTVVVKVDVERLRAEWPYVVAVGLSALSAIIAGAVLAYLL